MTRETIEKAAKKYAAENSWYPGETSYESDIREMEESFADAFKAGSQWRINSVWHKPSAYGDELKKDVEVIAKTKRGYRFGKFDVVGYSNEYIGFVSTSSFEYALSDVLEYAYLDDLLPEREEEMKKRFRKTGEIVDVISYNKYTTTKRNSELDWVSYIDSKGMEHEHEKRLNIYWGFEDVEEVPNKDVDWEQYRREIAKTMLHAIYLDDGNAERADKSSLGFEYKNLQSSAKEAVRFADALISVLKKGGEK